MAGPKRRVQFALLVLALASAVATTVQARALAGDTDHDGKLSLAEFQASRRSAVMHADTDHDGRVSRAEWTAAGPVMRARLGLSSDHGPRSAALFAVIDANGDGFITPAEIDAATRACFDGLDHNHDGFIDAAEAPPLPR